MQLFPHQEKFLKNYNGANLLAHEAGTGKTICACLWLKDGKDGNALTICPKQVKKKWEEELIKWGAKSTVVSKEEFKKMEHTQWTAIVMDEADCLASPLFTSNRSALSEHMYYLLKEYPTETLLLTATPIRSTPYNLHTLLVFAGHFIPFKKWRDYFFVLEKRPYNPRQAYYPVSDWRKKIRPVLEKYSDIVLLKDCVDYVPPATEEKHIKKIKKTDDFENFFDEHRFEQKDKIKDIKDIGKGYRKVLVVAYYVEQVEELYKQLSKERECFMLHGGVKNQEELIQRAQESDECYIIIQASIGAGFDLDTFTCAVFASMSYAVRDYVQMKARIRRIKNLHPVSYHYILHGRCDMAVLQTINKGKDFIPSEWRYDTPTTT